MFDFYRFLLACVHAVQVPTLFLPNPDTWSQSSALRSTVALNLKHTHTHTQTGPVNSYQHLEPASTPATGHITRPPQGPAAPRSLPLPLLRLPTMLLLQAFLRHALAPLLGSQPPQATAEECLDSHGRRHLSRGLGSSSPRALRCRIRLTGKQQTILPAPPFFH